MIKNKRQMKRKYRLFILILIAAVFAITIMTARERNLPGLITGD